MRRRPSARARCAVALFASDVRPGPPAAERLRRRARRRRRARARSRRAAIASDRALEGASVGIAILDVDSGRMLAAYNEHLALNPASNAKLYTAAAALATLHGDHRYETSLSGKLKGDAVAARSRSAATAIPSLSTEDLAALAQELSECGVHAGRRRHPRRPALLRRPDHAARVRAEAQRVGRLPRAHQRARARREHRDHDRATRPAEAAASARVDFDPPGLRRRRRDAFARRRRAAPTRWGSPSRRTARASRPRSAAAIAVDAQLVRFTRRVEDPRAPRRLRPAGAAREGRGQGLGRREARHRAGARARQAPLGPLSSLLYSLGKKSDNFYAEMIFK